LFDLRRKYSEAVSIKRRIERQSNEYFEIY